MQNTIKSKQMEIPARIRARIEQKLGRLARLVGDEARVEVMVSDEKTRSAKDRYSVHLEFSNIPYSIRGAASDVNVTTALDVALDKVTAQLSRQKRRHAAAHRLPVSPVKVLALSPSGGVSELEESIPQDETLDAVDNEEIWSQIREIRRVQTRPMSQQEVIARMDEEGLSFYPFFNAETDSVNVMYRLSNDQGYGLLVPAMEQA
jgi:putative sigma-54 modulation protein